MPETDIFARFSRQKSPMVSGFWMFFFFFFALPISAALCFKIFSNVALRVKSLLSPELGGRRNVSIKYSHKNFR